MSVDFRAIRQDIVDDTIDYADWMCDDEPFFYFPESNDKSQAALDFWEEMDELSDKKRDELIAQDDGTLENEFIDSIMNDFHPEIETPYTQEQRDKIKNRFDPDMFDAYFATYVKGQVQPRLEDYQTTYSYDHMEELYDEEQEYLDEYKGESWDIHNKIKEDMTEATAKLIDDGVVDYEDTGFSNTQEYQDALLDELNDLRVTEKMHLFADYEERNQLAADDILSYQDDDKFMAWVKENYYPTIDELRKDVEFECRAGGLYLEYIGEKNPPYDELPEGFREYETKYTTPSLDDVQAYYDREYGAERRLAIGELMDTYEAIGLEEDDYGYEY